MSQETIAKIRAARDEVLDGLRQALDAVEDELAEHTEKDSYLKTLAERHVDISFRIDKIHQQAVDAILALPAVVKAVNQLVALGDRMTKRAAELKNTTKKLSKTGEMLDIGRMFLDLIAEKEKKQSHDNIYSQTSSVRPTRSV